jgi:hypothetical protein
MTGEQKMKAPDGQKERRELTELYRLLHAMARALELIYDCLRRQQQALIEWRYEDFAGTIEEEKRLAAENLAREEERQRLVRELMGVESSAAITLRALAKNFGGPWPGRFERVARSLREAGGKAERMKKQNEFLISRSRDFVGGQIKLLLELARLNRNIYAKSGRKSRQASLYKVFDQKA